MFYDCAGSWTFCFIVLVQSNLALLFIYCLSVPLYHLWFFEWHSQYFSFCMPCFFLTILIFIIIFIFTFCSCWQLFAINVIFFFWSSRFQIDLISPIPAFYSFNLILIFSVFYSFWWSLTRVSHPFVLIVCHSHGTCSSLSTVAEQSCQLFVYFLLNSAITLMLVHDVTSVFCLWSWLSSISCSFIFNSSFRFY